MFWVFPYSGRVESLVIPTHGVYRLTVQGAGVQGGRLGTRMSGVVTLGVGDQLRIVVGQAGINTTYASGGTFIGVRRFGHEHDTLGSGWTPLIVAGGGGGSGSYSAGSHASLSEPGLGGQSSIAGAAGGAGGTLGRGGVNGSYGGGAGGGGFYTDGAGNANSAFVNGGGGIGGAGGVRGGGGGGYGGGGGGCGGEGGGGGGGSYNRLENKNNVAHVGNSHGWAKIEVLDVSDVRYIVYPVAEFKPVLNLQAHGAGIKVKWNKVV